MGDEQRPAPALCEYEQAGRAIRAGARAAIRAFGDHKGIGALR